MIALEAENAFVALSDDIATVDGYPQAAADDFSETASAPNTWETEPEDNLATAMPDAPTDDPIDLYFRDVRQHDLLSVAAERDLWRRIERHKARMRRALCLSTVALHTLTRLWNQVKHGEIQLQEMMHRSAEETAAPAGMREHLSDTIAQLHELATELGSVGTPVAAASIATTERGQQRRERARL